MKKIFLSMFIFYLLSIFSCKNNDEGRADVVFVEIASQDEWTSAFEEVENMIKREKAEEGGEEAADKEIDCIELSLSPNDDLILEETTIITGGKYYLKHTKNGQSYGIVDGEVTYLAEEADGMRFHPGIWAEIFNDGVWYGICTNSEHSDFKNENYKLLSELQEDSNIDNSVDSREKILEYLALIKGQKKPDELTDGAYKVEFSEKYQFDKVISSEYALVGFEKYENTSRLKTIRFIIEYEFDDEEEEPFDINFAYKKANITSDAYWPTFKYAD